MLLRRGFEGGFFFGIGSILIDAHSLSGQTEGWKYEYKGGPLCALSHEAKLNRTQNLEANTTARM
jgi:hypothetical protein